MANPSWWYDAAWLVFPDGTGYIHPTTERTVLPDGRVQLTTKRNLSKPYRVTVDADHPLARATRA